MFQKVEKPWYLLFLGGVLFTLISGQAHAYDYAYCENSAYTTMTDCNSNGYTWYECSCYDSSGVEQTGWSHHSCELSASSGYYESCSFYPPSTTTTTSTPTSTTTPSTTASSEQTNEEEIRRQQEEAARLARLKAEEENLRNEAKAQALAEAVASQFTASRESQAVAKTDENRVSGKNLGKLVHNRVMYVFAWRQGAIKSGAKTVKAVDPPQKTPYQGLAAGDQETKYGSWITPASTWMKNDAAARKYDGNLFTVMAGGDFKLTDNILIGTSVGYETLDLDTDYNNGSLKDNGFTVAPYFGYTITENLIFDVMLGYTYLDNDIDRIQEDQLIQGTFNHRGIDKPYSIQLDSERIKGGYDSHRFLISSNMNYYALIENWNLSAVLGYMYVNESEDAYREQGGENFQVESQNIYLSEWRFGGRAGYFINAFEPYLSAAYLYDNAWNNGGDDRDELEGVLGCNYYPTDSLILSVEAANSFFRDDIENTRIIFNLHLDF